MDNKIPHILIVDDDPNLLATISDILKLKGFEPVTAQTGGMALAQLERHSFDVALIDLRLEDMPGLKVLSGIKAHSPGTECILLTGHASQNSAIEAIQMGAYGYFQKPFAMEQILLSIQRAVEKSAAEKALWESERFAHATVDALSSHLVILDETGAILAVNRAWREFAKANSEGNPDLKLCEGANYLHVCNAAKGISSEEASAMAAGIRAVMSGRQKEFSLEYPCHSPDEKRWFTVRVTRFPGEGPLRIAVAHENITERKLAEEALHDSEEKYRLLIDQSPYAISIHQDGKLTFVNRAAISMMGAQNADELIGRPISAFIHPDGVDAARDRIQRMLQGETGLYPVEDRYVRLDGSVISVEVSATPFKFRGRPAIQVIALDITERKQAQEAQQQSEFQFRALFELSPDAVMLIDPHDPDISWPIIDCNEAACLMNGYHRDELIGQSIDIVNTTSAKQSDRNAYVKQIREAGNLKLETFHRHKNGTVFPVEVSTTLIKVGDRELVIGIDRDITERKRAEIEIKERTKELELINALNETVNRGDSLDKVMEVFASELRKISVCKDSSIYLLSPDGKSLVMQHLSIPPTLLKTIEQLTGSPLPQIRIPIKENSGLQNALQSERGVILTDPKSIQNRILEFIETSYLPTALRGTIRKFIPQIYKLLDIHSTLILPLISDKKVIGLLDVSSAEILTEKDLKRIQKISGQLTAVVLREQANKALLESEERYRSIFDGVQDAIFVETKDGRILEVNNRACEMYGYNRGEFIEKTVRDLVPEDNRVFSLSNIQPNISFSPLETVNRRANGDLFPIEISGSLQTINGEEILLVIVRDITERKQAEDALRASEQKYRFLFDEMLSGVAVHEIICDQQGKPIDYRFIAINTAFEKMTGLVSAAVVGRTVLEVMPATESLWIKRYGQVALTRIPIQFENYSSELGKYFEVRAFSPEKGKFATIFNDITERKQAERALYESEDRFKNSFQYSAIGMALVSLEGKWLKVNPMICSIVGYSEDELLTRTFQDITHPDDLDSDLNYLDQLRAGEIKSYTIEKRYFHKEGRVVWVLLVVALARDNAGAPLYFISQINDITDHKQAEEALRESEALYRQAIQVAGAVPYLQSYNSRGAELHYDFIGEGIRQITGYEAGEFNAALWDSLVQESILLGDLAGYPLEEAVRRVRSGELSLWKCEHRLRACDGKIHWVFETAVELYAENGVARGSIGMFQDITERKQAEENIRQRVKELELLYESGLMFSQLLNPREIAQKIIELLGEKLDWHHTAIRLVRPQDESLELVAFDQPGLEDTAEENAVEAHLRESVSRFGEGLSGWALEQSKIVRNGDVGSNPHYVESYPGIHSGLYVPLKSGDHMLGVISIESEQPNAFTEADEQLLTTLANQAANAFENARLYEETNRYAQELEQRVQDRTADLNRVNSDLTHAVRVKDEFLASMSHELRTPLTGILGLSEVLQLKIYGELNEKQGNTLKTIEESGRHLLDLINDILDLSKIEAGKLELEFAPCSLADICQASLQLIKGMAQHKHQRLHYTPLVEPIIVRADARRIKQMLVNLLSNAIKFTPPNGELGLEIEAIESERKVKLTVWDKGIGIKSEDMHKLFKPFTQLDSGLAREYSGTGLGLSLVHHLTELHNGGIEVESQIGEGSRFSIILPWSPQNTTPIPYISRHVTGGLVMPSEHSELPLVMFADDNEMVLQMVADFLEAKQYRVMKVRNGTELLEQAAEFHPDIMLVDIQMPGIGGMETIRRIRSHADPLVAAAPVIAVTALAMPADRERCLHAGANDYISKPLKLKVLVVAMQKLLERKP